MNDRFTFGTALYHPYIDIDDPRWLRNAALFWDHIHTIVPTAIEDPYENQDTHILAVEGILSPLAPDLHQDVLQRLEPRVLDFIGDPNEEDFFGIRTTGESTPETELLHAGKFGIMLGDEMGEARLYPDKVTLRLRQLFRERFGHWAPDEEGFLKVHPHFADFYMSVLAAGLAEKTGSSPLSNKGQAFGANLRTIVGQVASEERDHANGALVSIVMENLVIDPGVPIEQLLAFKRRNTAELERLAIEFDALAEKIKQAESVADLQDKAQRIYRKGVRPKLEALQTRLDRQSIGSAFGGVTLAATVAIAATTSPVGALLLGVGGFLTISNFALNSRFGRGNTRLDSPFTYLADLQRRFSIPKHLLE